MIFHDPEKSAGKELHATKKVCNQMFCYVHLRNFLYWDTVVDSFRGEQPIALCFALL